MSLDAIAAAAPVTRATEVQRIASDPTLSAFVSANAGSGKTKVLVDRVLRLLLAGTPPGKILCLTYTKAAAAHMAVKVFDRLAGWVTQSDHELAQELAQLEGRRTSPSRLVAARRLFAQAVETPGGLKIETIHAFCERVLHLVPFEANVPARFEVLDEAAQEELVADATRAVLGEAAAGGHAAAALTRVSLEAAGDLFTAAIRAALAQRAFLRDAAATPDGVAAAMEALARTFGLLPGDTPEAIERSMIEGGLPPADWAAIADELAASAKPTDRERGAALRLAAAATEPDERLESYLTVFFNGDGKPRANRLVTKDIAPALAERIRAERDRLAGLADRRRAALTVERTAALMTLAAAILMRVEALKHARGALDFDDLIDKTRTLLERSEAASWVLHKLDAGIDHVLVDEAQDTNPAQWDILRALTAEFTVGAGARQLDRTVFAVGDPKQSIYGFQGADPRAFAEGGRHFARAAAAADLRFEQLELNVSFRSAPAVLAAVDLVFGIPGNFAGLAFGESARARPGTVHATSRLGHYGRVEIWTPTAAEQDVEPDAWAAPLDTPEPTSAAVMLAERIARSIRTLVRDGDETGRRVPAGEVLILVRKRGVLFEAIIRALKSVGLPVAGADRLRLGEHMAALDLVAAGRAALLPDDDLTLAAMLKSPLVGLDDDDLVAIAARRPARTSLRVALADAAAAGHAKAAAALASVARFEDMSGRLGPFGFYATLLGPHGGRRALVARLGPEAHDAIDEFLALALAHEQRETPSLALFLARFADAAHDVKRDMDASRGEIRVMTVHGAKGLEAETVILADACRYDERLPSLLAIDVGGAAPRPVPVWLPPATERPAALVDACTAALDREREEHNRLLYVAMTRAKERLIIAPHLAKLPKEPPAECWYGMIDVALELAADADGGGLEVREVEDPLSGERLRVVASGAPAAPAEPRATAAAAPPAPAWLTTPAPREPARATPLLPSAAVDRAPERRAPGDRDRDARREGLLLHGLLERLPAQPAAMRAAAAERYVASQAGDWPAERQQALATEALAIVAAPRLKALFGPAGRSEVEVAGEVTLPGAGPVSVSGRIDRLAVTDDAVLVADFKSGATASGEPSDGHVAQLALYAALVRQALPGRSVRPLLVYRSGPTIIELTPEQQEEALRKLGRSTAAAAGPDIV